MKKRVFLFAFFVLLFVFTACNKTTEPIDNGNLNYSEVSLNKGDIGNFGILSNGNKVEIKYDGVGISINTVNGSVQANKQIVFYYKSGKVNYAVNSKDKLYFVYGDYIIYMDCLLVTDNLVTLKINNVKRN